MIRSIFKEWLTVHLEVPRFPNRPRPWHKTGLPAPGLTDGMFRGELWKPSGSMAVSVFQPSHLLEICILNSMIGTWC